jgi:hypothetical protein
MSLDDWPNGLPDGLPDMALNMILLHVIVSQKLQFYKKKIKKDAQTCNTF